MELRKILWIGPYLTKEQLNRAVKKGYRQVAASLSQQYFINGIEKNINKGVEIISAIRPPAFPSYTDMVIKRKEFSHSKGIKSVSVGFFNVKYLNHFFRTNSLVKEARRWAYKNKGVKANIIVYALHSPFLKAALEVKRILPDSKIVVIVPDLPLNMDMSSLVQRILKKIDWRIIKRLMCSVDKYILYTRHMADYLNLRPEQWIVVEGLIDESKVQDYPVPSKYEKKVCLYMGTLKKEYKIDKFVEAFIIANIPNTELHIYGNGDLKNELIRISQKYHTIKYCGYVSSDEAFNIMKKATLLVNPRPTNDDYTRYSCPSKTFEYMASGTPLLTTKLLGIPDEYFEYVYSFEDESIEGMASTLKRILIKDDLELNKQGLRAREFIKKYKSNYKQCEKVVKFLSEN